MKKIPSTNQHKLSAERVAKVTKKLIRRLVQKGVLRPSKTAPPLDPTTEQGHSKAEGVRSENGSVSYPDGSGLLVTGKGLVLVERRSVYRAFKAIKGGRADAEPSSRPAAKPEENDR